MLKIIILAHLVQEKFITSEDKAPVVDHNADGEPQTTMFSEISQSEEKVKRFMAHQ